MAEFKKRKMLLYDIFSYSDTNTGIGTRMGQIPIPGMFTHNIPFIGISIIPIPLPG